MIVAGFGFRRSVTQDSLLSLWNAECVDHAPCCVATISDKAQTPAFQAFQAGLGMPARHVDQSDLPAQQTKTQSATSQAARGTGSVAEAVALAAAGPGATLIKPRVISADGLATCALAQTAPSEGELS